MVGYAYVGTKLAAHADATFGLTGQYVLGCRSRRRRRGTVAPTIQPEDLPRRKAHNEVEDQTKCVVVQRDS